MALVCLQTCELAADCPDSAKNCEELGGTGPNANTRVCKCTTDELCAGGDTTGSSAICSDAFGVCVTKCGGDTDCPTGYTCETGTGECRATGAGGTCTYDSCGPDLNCNLTTGQCEPARTCTSTGTQPDVCGYGQYCNTVNLCDFVSRPTCSNITQAGIDWDPATSSGPVIYEITQEYFDQDPSFCPGTGVNKRARFRVDAYGPPGTFSTQSALNSVLKYYQTSGALGPTPGIQNLTVSNNGQNATFDINFCASNALEQLQIGLRIDEGNGFCATAR
ncbi:hypothetical protein JQX13_38040 [Archangium violaceum]|uniref:hypothetical protein n=1 Tax=Archangium violaceum TaxID=83451 RepID=UPI00193C6BB1|nr:hypothetical protein [Archangium violaceum]QRK05898.1 hypothetical protein JQX13_38040 [Archangium violaceum]